MDNKWETLLMTEYAYSLNDDEYYDSDCIIDLIECEYAEGDRLTIYVAEKVKFTHLSFINGRELIENMQEAAYEDSGDYADGYLDDIDLNKIGILKKLIADFLDKNTKPITFYRVKKVKEMEITVGEYSFMEDL